MDSDKYAVVVLEKNGNKIKEISMQREQRKGGNSHNLDPDKQDCVHKQEGVETVFQVNDGTFQYRHN